MNRYTDVNIKTNKWIAKQEKLARRDRFLTKTIQWLGKMLKIANCYLRFCLSLKAKIMKIWKTRGEKEVIIYTKSLRSCLMAWTFSGFQIDHNLPKPLRELKSFVNKEGINNAFIRLVYTVLYITRTIKLTPVPSFATIEAKPEINSVILDRDFNLVKIKGFLRRIGINPSHLGRVPYRARFKSYHMTSKSGPNGHALFDAYHDFDGLTEEMKEDIKIIGGKKLSSRIDSYEEMLTKGLPLENWDEFSSKKKGSPTITRKLACLADKEGKTREIAILDYWSQTALRQCHNYLFHRLSRLPNDCTHNQTKLLLDLKPTEGHNYHSIDLTAATDTIPIEVFKRILHVWFGQQYSESWARLLVGHPFSYQDRTLMYNTGNPMGAYTSFAALAFSQHYFVYLACLRANIKFSDAPYMVLGDDIVIANDDIAFHYKEILLELGIPISKPKTHVSPFGFEFAKRIVFNGEMLSPFPIAALFERRNNLSQIIGIIYNSLNEGWQVESIPDVIVDYLGYQGYSSSRRKKLKPKIRLTVDLIKYLSGHIKDLGNSLMDYVAFMAGKKYDINIMLRTVFVHSIVLKVLVKARKSSADKVEKVLKGKLDPLAENILLDVYEYYYDGDGLDTDLYWVPYLGLMDKYIDRSFTYYTEEINPRMTITPRLLKKEMSVVDIPLSGEHFSRRNRDVIVTAALHAARLIHETLKVTHEVKLHGKSYPLPWAETVCGPVITGAAKSERDRGVVQTGKVPNMADLLARMSRDR